MPRSHLPDLLLGKGSQQGTESSAGPVCRARPRNGFVPARLMEIEFPPWREYGLAEPGPGMGKPIRAPIPNPPTIFPIMSRHQHHHHNKSHPHQEPRPKPLYKRKLFVLAVILMLIGMVVYVVTMDESVEVTPDSTTLTTP